jgi:glucose 1-dehydrogenase
MNKIVLITGASGGIGRATAETFNRQGWFVIGVDKTELKNLPGISHFIIGDVAQVDCWETVASQLDDRGGRVNVLVNNAAIQNYKPLVKTTPEEWDAVMASNLRSVYLAVSYLYPFMKKDGGAIVNVSSVHAIATSVNTAAYAASKGAVSALTRALAIELAPDGIRVNAVLPGAVDTPMLRSGLSRGHLSGSNLKELMDNLAQKTVLGKIGKAEEIAQAILFLSDHRKSSFITGQSVVVDGGATVKLSTE